MKRREPRGKSTARIIWDTKSKKVYEPKSIDTKIIEVVADHLMAVADYLGFKNANPE